MKRNLKLVTIISLFIVAISFVSCSKNDDPADNDIFVGTYKGRITYLDGNVHKAADNGSVTVVKAGGSYYFRFSDGIPNLKGVKFKKEGDHTLVNIDFKEGVTFIRINASTLNILYTMDGKIWTANAKRQFFKNIIKEGNDLTNKAADLEKNVTLLNSRNRQVTGNLQAAQLGNEIMTSILSSINSLNATLVNQEAKRKDLEMKEAEIQKAKNEIAKKRYLIETQRVIPNAETDVITIEQEEK